MQHQRSPDVTKRRHFGCDVTLLRSPPLGLASVVPCALGLLGILKFLSRQFLRAGGYPEEDMLQRICAVLPMGFSPSWKTTLTKKREGGDMGLSCPGKSYKCSSPQTASENRSCQLIWDQQSNVKRKTEEMPTACPVLYLFLICLQLHCDWMQTWALFR